MDLSAQYRDMLLRLFPKGKAWFTDAGSYLFNAAWGSADELARLHLRAFQLIEEADPRTTQEMLSDWQRALGLPDTCCPPGESTSQQRFEVVSRFKGGYGNSPQSFINIASELGYTVTVIPFFAPFQVGPISNDPGHQNTQVGGALTNGDWQYAFQINAQIDWSVLFRVGLNCVGDPLASGGHGGNTQLECKIKQAMPAHSIVLFSYS